MAADLGFFFRPGVMIVDGSAQLILLPSSRKNEHPSTANAFALPYPPLSLVQLLMKPAPHIIWGGGQEKQRQMATEGNRQQQKKE